jgi:hypothetical protein
MIARPIPAF